MSRVCRERALWIVLQDVKTGYEIDGTAILNGDYPHLSIVHHVAITDHYVQYPDLVQGSAKRLVNKVFVAGETKF